LQITMRSVGVEEGDAVIDVVDRVAQLRLCGCGIRAHCIAGGKIAHRDEEPMRCRHPGRSAGGRSRPCGACRPPLDRKLARTGRPSLVAAAMSRSNAVRRDLPHQGLRATAIQLVAFESR